MTLILRVDPVEHVLRSVGETAPGIVCAGQLDDGTFSFTASATWAPSPTVMQMGAVLDQMGISGVVTDPGEPDPSMIPFSPQEAIDACVDDQTVGAVIMGAQACFDTVWQRLGRCGAIDPCRECLDFVEAVYLAAAARHVRDPEPDA